MVDFDECASCAAMTIWTDESTLAVIVNQSTVSVRQCTSP